jgi:hypothetical protein
MNTENTKSRSKLEQLSPEQQEMLLDLAKRSSLVVLAESLKESGIETSDSALSRFLQKRRAANLVENGKELAASVEALAEQGRGGRLREGTLEVMRQQFFEKAAGGLEGEEGRDLYAALVAEEARVKELELEARKVAALEQQVRLQERRIEVEAMKARAALGRVKAQVLGSKALAEGVEGEPQAQLPAEVGSCGERAKLEVRAGRAGGPSAEGEPPKGGTTCGLLLEGEPPKGGTTCGSVVDGAPVTGASDDHAKREVQAGQAGGRSWERLLEVMKVAEGILNRGGDPGERVLEARGLLAEGLKEVGR